MRFAAAIAVAVALTAAAVTLATREHPPRGPAERFLGRYVEPDGRVVRRDQGGDTVSEGQAYAMLLAVAAGDEERFARVWGWTAVHLRRDDGLLAWRWTDGRVAGADPAADADLDAARALVLAGERFDEPRYAAAGRALGRAIAAHETTLAAGKTVLVAGTWAREKAVVNPSYLSPRAFEALGLTRLEASSRRLMDRLTASRLPPDWARVQPWGVAPAGPGGSDGDGGYGYDAVRTPVRLAESCDPADRALAARMWPRLMRSPGAPQRTLDGAPRTEDEHPAALVGAAAAARAAGDARASRELLQRADALDAERPTYYGSAWVALGRVMLETDDLGPC